VLRRNIGLRVTVFNLRQAPASGCFLLDAYLAGFGIRQGFVEQTAEMQAGSVLVLAEMAASAAKPEGPPTAIGDQPGK
jgi:hypothetical protein